MSRRLLVINVALGIVSVVLAVGIFRTLLVKRPIPPPAAPRTVSAPASAAAAAAGDAGPAAYTVIAARNLFNPSRSETAAAAAPVAKPILHGVVIVGAKSRAFLEDPMSKRVAGYSVGDKVGGGTIQKIADDRVVIARPEGLLEVLLQDPSKPRPTPTAPTAPAQVAPQQPGAAPIGPAQLRPPQVGPAEVPPGPPQVGSPPNQAPPALPQVRRRILPQGQPGNE
ncbi:MAG TPA: type II secretion system protein N [Methylomirabilota bacterium]